MKREDLKYLSREDVEQLVCEWVLKYHELEEQNNNIRKRLEKLESGICGGSPCIISEFHSFEGESWIKATTYDDVLLRLKNANERISKLNVEHFSKTIEQAQEADKIRKENKELESENKALKQRIKDLEDVCDGSCFSEKEDERDKLIAELQDKRQQYCIRINDLTTTVHVLAELYSALRKNVGMD